MVAEGRAAMVYENFFGYSCPRFNLGRQSGADADEIENIDVTTARKACPRPCSSCGEGGNTIDWGGTLWVP